IGAECILHEAPPTCGASAHTRKETRVMRASGLAIAAAFVFGVSGGVFAQSAAAPPPPTTTDYFGPTQSHWTAAGFVGGNVGGNTTDTESVTFGGQVAYLWHGMVGIEGIGDYAHSFKIANALLADDPQVLTYMANAIAAFPIGAEGDFKPYFSAGVGGISMKTSVFGIATDPAAIVTSDGHQTRFGVDIGGGFMGFVHNLGVRGDIRYY